MHDGSDGFVLTSKRLTLAAARAAGDAAIAAASARGLKMTVAVLDLGCELLQLSRMDGANVGTVDVAVAKARCAVKFRRATKEFADAYRNGATALIGLPHLIAFEGGIPIVVGDELVGGIGASGAAPDLDGVIAAAGLDAIMQRAR